MLLVGVFALTFGAAWVVLSPGPLFGGRTEIPQVSGLQVAEAEKRLSERGFRVQLQDEPAIGTEVPGTVLRQDPVSSTAAPQGFTVVLGVSTGQALATMPDVIGFPVELAREVVKSAGLRVGTVDSVAGQPDARGLVLVTRPAAGTARTAGDAVDLVVSHLP